MCIRDRSNQRSKIPGIFIWEAGRVFFKSTSELPLEAEQIALLSYGALARETWLSGPEESDFYQMKGIVSALLGLLGIKDVKYLPGAGMPFHPGRSAKILSLIHISCIQARSHRCIPSSCVSSGRRIGCRY